MSKYRPPTHLLFRKKVNFFSHVDNLLLTDYAFFVAKLYI